MRFAISVCVCAVAVAGVGCADGRGVPTSPSAIASVSGLASTTSQPLVTASPRSGDVHITKECSHFGEGYCTIQTSNVKAIEPGTRVVYLQPDLVADPKGSEVVLDPPGPGNNKAFGNCSVARGDCTFSGGT